MNKTGPKRKLATYLIASGWGLFVVSLALPCYEANLDGGDLLGWEAAWCSFSFPFDEGIKDRLSLVLAACGLCNLVFGSSLLLLRFRKESDFYYKYDLHFIGTDREPSQSPAQGAVFRTVPFLLLGATIWVCLAPLAWNGYQGFLIGYYVWVASFLLVTAGFFIQAGMIHKGLVDDPEGEWTGSTERTGPL